MSLTQEESLAGRGGSRRIPPALALLLLLAAAPLPARSEGRPDCESPKTCPVYHLYQPPIRWRAASDGVVRIPYDIFPVQPRMPEDRAIAAIRAAVATWEAYNPKLRFVYLGVRSTPPWSGDGRNSIGFADPIMTGLLLPTSVAGRAGWWVQEEPYISCHGRLRTRTNENVTAAGS